jgi:N-acetyl-anhydromuramyl-L-alanine amidase AmpD
VVYVGGVASDGKTAKDTRTPAQKAALMAVRDALMAKYPAVAKVAGHNDYTDKKACPSFKVGNDPLGRIA